MDLLHKISSRVFWLVEKKKEGCKFGMIYPQADVSPGFREARKRVMLALVTFGQTETWGIRRTGRA